MAKMISFTPYLGLRKTGEDLKEASGTLCALVADITGKRAAFVVEGKGHLEHVHILIEGAGSTNPDEWENGMKYLGKENEPTVVGPRTDEKRLIRWL